MQKRRCQALIKVIGRLDKDADKNRQSACCYKVLHLCNQKPADDQLLMKRIQKHEENRPNRDMTPQIDAESSNGRCDLMSKHGVDTHQHQPG